MVINVFSIQGRGKDFYRGCQHTRTFKEREKRIQLNVQITSVHMCVTGMPDAVSGSLEMG